MTKIQPCVIVPDLRITLHTICKEQDIAEEIELAVVELGLKVVAIYHILNLFIVIVLTSLSCNVVIVRGLCEERWFADVLRPCHHSVGEKAPSEVLA